MLLCRPEHLMPRATRVTVAASLPLSHTVIPTQLPSHPGHRPPGRPRRCPKASCLPSPLGPSSTQPAKWVTMGWPRPGRAMVAIKALLVLSVLQVPAQAVVRAMLEDNSSSVDFADLPALFGVPLAPEGIRGYLMEVKPANACHPIEAPRLGNHSLGAIALIRRYDCAFDLKVLNAQRAGFKAAIVHNVHSNDLVSMTHVYEDQRGQIAIPSVFVGEAASQDLRVMGCDKSAHVLLLPDDPPCHDLDCHLVLTVSWALGCTLVLVGSAFFVLNRLWLWAQACCSRKRPVKTSTSQKAQVRIFTRRNDLCAICLDEYEEGDQLKILPCSHTYHCKCIDPWFSQAPRRSCPVCKQSVAGTEDGFDSNTDSFRDEDPSLPGHRPPIWAIQARLRSRRLELLGRTSPYCRCSTTSLEAEDTTVSRAPPEAPGW
ncbi:E3 ubiquitin-protein ligase ZNRF4 [Symphalangus syndactylus]|uniref:E3 ubiquitin-protein ligase ZNRF4 n=1 Tax=Symphalangus syndactylus TaxID=9590 RepID=UPI002442EB76|nr:E3 ubiquitin-protein ligase ZNRF4 [Symphalangus syndactylus]XP_055107360.1 E3 ubiquitin-protein ligase ZNRF4 [Symphalangus syndactylus]